MTFPGDAYEPKSRLAGSRELPLPRLSTALGRRLAGAATSIISGISVLAVLALVNHIAPSIGWR